jgi:hypothetical protein
MGLLGLTQSLGAVSGTSSHPSQPPPSPLCSLSSQARRFGVVGVVEIAHDFDGVAVLEVSRQHPLCVMPAYIISCRVVTVLTLSRQDVLKVSVEVFRLLVCQACILGLLVEKTLTGVENVFRTAKSCCITRKYTRT